MSDQRQLTILWVGELADDGNHSQSTRHLGAIGFAHAKRVLAEEPVDAVISAHAFEDGNGIELLEHVRACLPGVARILVSDCPLRASVPGGAVVSTAALHGVIQLVRWLAARASVAPAAFA